MFRLIPAHALCLFRNKIIAMMTIELFGAALICFAIFYKAIDFFEKI